MNATVASNYITCSLWFGNGASVEAQRIARLACNASASLRGSPQMRAFDELRSLREIYGGNEVRLTERTYAMARRFLQRLPPGTSAPEASLDPDGEIAFDWFGPRGKNFSISVRHDGRLSYAGRLAQEVSVHGTDELVDTVPRRILETIAEVVAPA